MEMLRCPCPISALTLPADCFVEPYPHHYHHCDYYHFFTVIVAEVAIAVLLLSGYCSGDENQNSE